MTLAFLFWLLMILWLIFGFLVNWPTAPGTRPWPLGSHIVLWIVIALLGWRVFGAALHG
jgi:hypothetical protein